MATLFGFSGQYDVVSLVIFAVIVLWAVVMFRLAWSAS